MRGTVESMPVPRPARAEGELQHLCLDLGYDDDQVRALAEDLGFTLHLPPRKHHAKKVRCCTF